ncbi:MAG TPA: divalent-cation tolerance protein CutA [Syntrophorhabdaceae bacterium]|jgi:periplasmic divalent cation tolerance protein|nr:divalent-cation tolerance protein CutA [Syntrophorhabdaceae bacterium]HQM77179.1 divalent-cation tolerance protein CutA [Syntrophorhabdaceae bacterium]
MSDIIEMIITFGDRDTAERIGRNVVEKRLAACAQIEGPIKSIYWWKEELEESEEWKCTFKTRKDLYKSLEDEIRLSHPYELPQIVAVGIDYALSGYVDWIKKETKKIEDRG